MLEIFQFLFQFFQDKMLLFMKTWLLQILRPETGLRIAPNWPRIEKVTMTPHFSEMISLSIIFWRCFVSFVKFRYGSKFHVIVISGSRIMTIFFYTGLTRNPEIRNTPVWVFHNIWRLGRVMDTKIYTNVCNRTFLNAAKCQSYYLNVVFELLRENQLGGGKGKPPSPHPYRD